MKPTLLQAALAEVLGTFLLILFGCGAVHSAVLTGAQSGLWQVAIVWGVAIMLAAYVCGGISGAHINPAITIALALWGRFDWSRVPAYILAQLGGAMLAAAALFLLYGLLLEKKELDKGVTRGEMGSIVTAMCYGEYYPAPGGMASDDKPYSGEAWTKFPAPSLSTLPSPRKSWEPPCSPWSSSPSRTRATSPAHRRLSRRCSLASAWRF